MFDKMSVKQRHKKALFQNPCKMGLARYDGA